MLGKECLLIMIAKQIFHHCGKMSKKKRVLFFILGNRNYCTAEGVRNKSRWEQILCLPSFRQHVACRCPWLEESCQKVRKISLEKKSAAVLTHPKCWQTCTSIRIDDCHHTHPNVRTAYQLTAIGFLCDFQASL